MDAGSAVESVADCGGAGKALGCGFQVVASDAQVLNVIVQSAGANGDASLCAALLRRTAAAGSTAGARIQALATCRA